MRKVQNDRPWMNYFLGIGFVYVLIAVIMMITGSSVAQAWGAPAAVLIGPAIGIAVVRHRKTKV